MTNKIFKNNKLSFSLLAFALVACSVAPIDETVADDVTTEDALIATTTEQAYPCQHQPEFRDFDFWIGEWDVATASGVHAGRDVINAVEKGCVLLEQSNDGGEIWVPWFEGFYSHTN